MRLRREWIRWTALLASRRHILAVAERWQATLVVVGRTGRGWLQELALGSTAHEVARRSPVPVLVHVET